MMFSRANDVIIILNPFGQAFRKSQRHVAMVAEFLDDNKPEIHLKREFAPFQTSSILFYCWRNFLGLYSTGLHLCL